MDLRDNTENIVNNKHLIDDLIDSRFAINAKDIYERLTKVESQFREVSNLVSLLYKVGIGTLIGVVTLIIFNLIRLLH